MELATLLSSIVQREEHSNIALQYPLAHSHFLHGRLPISCPLLHHWSISRKVHAIESGLVDKAVAFTVKAIEVKGTYETIPKFIIIIIIIIIIINIVIFLIIN